MEQKVCQIGIIGTGRIAHRFVVEARFVEGVEITAVYNPRISSAVEFAKEFDIPFPTDCLEDFLDKVDGVYIASPHDTHVDYSRKMLIKGKHVLCEKPLAFSAEEILELGSIAQKKKVVIMEALKTAYLPGFDELIKRVQSGIIGEVASVESCFTKLVPEDSREVADRNFGGSFFELGSYALLPIRTILGKDYQSIRFWSKNYSNGNDAYTVMNIDYGKAYATAKVGLGVKSEGELLVNGTRGYIRVPAPWWLTREIEVHYEDPNATEHFIIPYEGDGLRYEVKAFIERIKGEESLYGISLSESAWIADVMSKFCEDRIKNYDSNR